MRIRLSGSFRLGFFSAEGSVILETGSAFLEGNCLIHKRLTKVLIFYVEHLRHLRRFPPFFLAKIAKVLIL
jgi:hypothetical protein